MFGISFVGLEYGVETHQFSYCCFSQAILDEEVNWGVEYPVLVCTDTGGQTGVGFIWLLLTATGKEGPVAQEIK